MDEHTLIVLVSQNVIRYSYLNAKKQTTHNIIFISDVYNGRQACADSRTKSSECTKITSVPQDKTE